MAQYRVLASEERQRYIYTKTHKNIKEKKVMYEHAFIINIKNESHLLGYTFRTGLNMSPTSPDM
jgi:hypothetical protein